MSKEMILMILLFMCVMGSILYRRYIIHKTLRKLYDFRINGNEEAYMKAIDALDVKVYFPVYTRELLRFHYYIDQKQHAQVVKHYDTLRKIKTKPENRIAMYSSAFSYFLDSKENAKAKECCSELYRLLEHRKETKYVAVLQEVRQLEGIYLKHDTSWISILEDVCEKVKDAESLSVLKYRLAKLYMIANDQQMSKRALSEAMSLTKSEASQARLQYLLNHPQELN